LIYGGLDAFWLNFFRKLRNIKVIQILTKISLFSLENLVSLFLQTSILSEKEAHLQRKTKLM